ncbi:extracellular solute-binding protein family 1 [Paenibacillus sp. JCM 10914]|nr:extracellular solute-binding protein family 1 [Paenibacillus sp. JCM 10914]
MAWGLSGCLGNRSADIHDSFTSVTPTDEPEATLKFYFGGEKKAATDEVWAAVSEYVKGKGLNVKFSIQFIPWPEYYEKLLVMAAAGDRWDLNFDSEGSFRQMASRGSYMALDKLLPEYAPSLYRKYQMDGNLRSTTMNGDIVGLPWSIKMNQRPYAGWRVDLAEKAGIYRAPDSVKTVEDVDVLLQELKDAYPDSKVSRITALPFYVVREEWLDLGFHGLGIDMNDPEFKVQAIEQQLFYIEAAQMSKKWYENKILSPDSLIDRGDSAEQWRNGKVLFTLTSHEWAYAADLGFVDPNYRQQMSLLYPDKKQMNRSPISNVLAINRNSEHPELVLRFLDMMETDRKLYDLVIYGIEGKTYEKDGEQVIYPDNLSLSTSNYMDWGGQWALWNPRFIRSTETYPGDFWGEEARFAELPMNIDSPLEGLLLSDYAISKEVEKRAQLYENLGRSIEYGLVSDVEKEITAYRIKQQDSGLDVVIGEIQRQVNLYLASTQSE